MKSHYSLLSPLTSVTVSQKAIKTPQFCTKASTERGDTIATFAHKHFAFLCFIALVLVKLLTFCFLSYQIQVSCQLSYLPML